MEINVCFSCDDNYVQHMAVAIASILLNSSIQDTYNFYIMDGGISSENKDKLQELRSIRDFGLFFIIMDNNMFKDCPMTNYVKYITIPTYYRFKIASLFPDLDKILYMDCDMVVKADLAELYLTNIDDYYMAAVPEAEYYTHHERLEIFGDNYYCNAGLLLININKWREDNIEQKLFDYAKAPLHEIIYQDQDILNDVLKYNILYLPIKWNLQHSTTVNEDAYIYRKKEQKYAVLHPSVIHFTSPLKPWVARSNNIYRNEYLKYLEYTPWKLCVLKIRLLRCIFDLSMYSISVLKKIIEIYNYDEKRVVKIFGVKIKFNNDVMILKKDIKNLSSLVEVLTGEIENLKWQLDYCQNIMNDKNNLL